MRLPDAAIAGAFGGSGLGVDDRLDDPPRAEDRRGPEREDMCRASTLSDGTVAMNSGNVPVTPHPTKKIEASIQAGPV